MRRNSFLHIPSTRGVYEAGDKAVSDLAPPPLGPAFGPASAAPGRSRDEASALDQDGDDRRAEDAAYALSSSAGWEMSSPNDLVPRRGRPARALATHLSVSRSLEVDFSYPPPLDASRLPSDLVPTLDKAMTAQGAYARTGAAATLDDAIDAWHYLHSHPLVTAKPDLHLLAMENLAVVHLQRHWAGGPGDLNCAIRYFSQMHGSEPLDDDLRLRLRAEYGLALRQRYRESGLSDDVDMAIQLYRERLDLTPVDSPDRAECYDSLGNVLQERYLAGRAVKDLDTAIVHFERALGAAEPGSLRRSDILSDLAIALEYRCTEQETVVGQEQVVDHERAVDLLGEAVGTVEAIGEGGGMTEAESGRVAAKQGRMLRNLYSLTDDPEYLKQSVTAYEKAVAGASALSPDWVRRTRRLADVQSDGYARLGEVSLLESAKENYRRSLTSMALRPAPEGLEDDASRRAEKRLDEEAARLWRYRQRRRRLLAEVLKFDWQQGVVAVVPSLSADRRHARVIASEDMLAFAAISDALVSAGCPAEQVETEIADDVVEGDRRNLVLICSPRRNSITRAVLDHPMVRTVTGIEFFDMSGRSDAGGGREASTERWALRVAGTPMESPSYAQTTTLERAGKDPMKGPLEDYSLLARLPSPWNTAASVIVVAGLRAFGTWGTAQFLRDRGADLLQQTEGRNFVMVVRVRTEGFKVETDPKPVFLRLL